jgi:uncharacterized phage-like protein YoqJ
MTGCSTSISAKDYNWNEDEKVTKKSAADYAKEDKRIYKPPSTGLKPPIGMNISTDELFVNVIKLDLTGSMHKEPERFLEKMSTLYEESNAALQGYDSKDMQKKAQNVPDVLSVSIIGIGDAYVDKYPLQVTNFEKRSGLIKSIKDIFPEGGGGGQLTESYELGAYYLLNHCKTPKCKKPLCIIFGDEAPYDRVNCHQVKALIGDDLKQDLSTTEVLKELKEKFDTYIIQPELEYSEAEYKEVHEKWRKILGPQRVIVIESVARAVDCIIGLNGVYSNNWDAAKDMLERRQKPDQVKEVIEALHPTLKEKSLV